MHTVDGWRQNSAKHTETPVLIMRMSVLFCFVYKYFISLKRGACLPHMNELRTFCGVIHKSLTATVKYFLMIFDVVV